MTLANPAPTGGASFGLTASPAAAGTIPATLTIPAGQQTVNFPITNASVPPGAASASLLVTAINAQSSAQGTLTINAQVTLTTVTFSPNHVNAGQTAVGTVKDEIARRVVGIGWSRGHRANEYKSEALRQPSLASARWAWRIRFIFKRPSR